MASFSESPVLEICHEHKREQSQDSGAYIDWNSEDSASPTGNLDNVGKGEFVTVVAVESNGGNVKEEVSPFVTVLEINDEDEKIGDKLISRANEDIEEEVLVYRLPGERLGFGLKFEGGTNTAENVKRLFIQSSAPDSPASRAQCSWGKLTEGDEIIKVDGHEVKNMTRLDCVRCLKESSVVIKLYVRHSKRTEQQSLEVQSNGLQSCTSPLVISAEMKKKVPPPPPIPPRKVPRKVLAPLHKYEVTMLGPPDGFCDNQQVPVPKMRNLQTSSEDNLSAPKSQSKSSVFVPAKEIKQDFGDSSRKLNKRSGFDLKHIPPEPEVYLDILAQEDTKSNWESESDDTGSTISTVMGFSMTTNSSFSDLRSNTSSYCDSTTPSTPTSTPSTPVLDLAKVLTPSEANDFLFTRMINDKGHDTISYDDKSSICSEDNTPLQPPLSFQDAPLSYGNEEIKVSLSDLVEAQKEDVNTQKNSSKESSEDTESVQCNKNMTSKSSTSSKKSSLIPRLAKSIGLIATPPKPSPRKEARVEKSRGNKKRPPPPPPPPPRTDRPPCPQPETESKTLIPYLKKKKTKNESPKVVKEASAAEDTRLAVNADRVDEAEVTVEQGGEDSTLSWPVPELKNLRQDVGAEAAANTESEADTFVSGSSETEMEGNRDPYFLLQWGSSKHLETIGEDEEDGCSDDVAPGCSLEEKQEQLISSKSDSDSSSKSEKDEESGDGEIRELPIIKQNGESKEENKNELADNALKLAIAEDDVSVVASEDLRRNEDESVIDKRDSKAAEEKELSNDNGGFKHDADNVQDDDEHQSNGGMNERMVPIVTATAGLVPPPTFNRLPPDGHEFPQNYQEASIVMPGKLKEDTSMLYENEFKSDLPPLPTSEPPISQKYSFRLDSNIDILPNKKSFPSDILEDPVRLSRASLWRQDEKSEKSVRDKIAMFSSTPDANSFCSGKISKYKSSDDVFYDDDADCVRNLPNGKHFSRSVVSIDKIGGFNNHVRGFSKKYGFSESSATPRSLDYANRTQSSMDLTSSSSSAYSSSCSPDSSLSSTTSSYLGYSSTLPRKNSRNENPKNDIHGQKHSGVTRTTSFSIHGRSQSLLDINPSPYKSRLKLDGSTDDDHKQSSLNLLIEQRRKNLSKLRGLVIPEKFPDIPPSQPIFDLPEIKSRDLILTSKISNAYKEENRPTKWESQYSQNNSSVSLTSPPWKIQNKSPAVPKYSPAFKRKTISIYGSSSSPVKNDLENSNGLREAKPPAKPPRTIQTHQTYDNFTVSKNGDCPKPAPDSIHRYSQNDLVRTNGATEMFSSCRKGKYRISDLGRSEEDSDNDSAVSSSRSSTSHGFSPPSSPLLDNQHQELSHRSQLYSSSPMGGTNSPVTRSLSSETTASATSNTSTLTSGSQASCGNGSGDINNKRVLKAQSVEAINRKNVLASARYSRGFDVKSGSPLIQRKFPMDPGKSEYDGATDSSYLIGSNNRKSSDSVAKPEIVNYKLPSDVVHTNTKPMCVKVAFMNDVDEICSSVDKKKLTKTESSPSLGSFVIQQERRTSVPFENTQWNSDEEWSQKKSATGDTFHKLLTEKPSSESLKSRTSSVDTVVENSLINENGLDFETPRLKTARNSIETDTLIKPCGPLESGDSLPDKSINTYSKTRFVKTGFSPKEVSTMSNRNQRSVSVNDIRKAFEKVDLTMPSNGRGSKAMLGLNGNHHARVSSLDSTNSEDSCVFGPAQYGSSSNLHREQFGSITSLASSTSLISPQELQMLIDDANQTLEESGGCSGGSPAVSHDVLVVILHRDTTGGSVGITLAGGADYESKEITVHKVLSGSPADRDGRIQKGDRILSINGKSMKGITHRESLAILKSPRPEVVLVVSRPKSDSVCDPVINDDNVVTTPVRPNILSTRPPRILEGTTLNDSGESINGETPRGPPATFILVKDGAGLGFSLEGGKDSPVGDKPLVIKKIFTGGAAEKCGHLKAGDEILNVNGIDVTLMSRIEAWKLMKRLPDGNVSITVRHQVETRPGPEVAR